MIIGIPKEMKSHESRVSLTPAAVHELVQAGHKVCIQTTAGAGSSFSDEKYREAGAEVLHNMREVYKKAEMIVKVKEPLESEYMLIRAGQIVFTFFHFASSRALTSAMISRKGVCLAYEAVENSNGTLPLLVPMSEVAGRMCIQQGAKYLESHKEGCGILLGGVPGVEAARVLVIGGGIVGTEAAKVAAGLGANVTLLDKNLFRLRYLSEVLPSNVQLLISNNYMIRKLAPTHHLIIGSVLIHGAKAPRLITREMLGDMQSGTVMVDVAVDQGGCFETTKPTTHDKPTYNIEGIIHYCVTNMPGAVPHTSTHALTNATTPYVMEIANKGWQRACTENPELRMGVSIAHGKITSKPVAETFDMDYTPVEKVLSH